MNRSEALFRWALWLHVAALAYIIAAGPLGLPLVVGAQNK